MMDIDRQQVVVLRGRYEIRERLGGGQGETFLGLDRQTDTPVVIKLLDMRDAGDWKTVELFERESAVLSALSHPRIPALVDAFVDAADSEEPESGRLVLVQAYIAGKNLRAALRDGLRVGEEKARQMAESLLETLAYLHSQSPPVVHRDVKPDNIILGDDSELFLVDFGAVGRFVSARSGSTVVGSAGYVPVEQLAGQACPASDLYALGATLLFLLSRRAPTEFALKDLQLQFRDAINVSPQFADFLQALLMPAPEERPRDAQAALALLREPPAQLPVGWAGELSRQWTGNPAHLPRRLRPPANSGVTIWGDASALHADLVRGFQVLPAFIMAGGGVIFGQGLLVVASGASATAWMFALAVMIFGLVMLGMGLTLMLVRTRLSLRADGFEIERSLGRWRRRTHIPIEDFQGLFVQSLPKGGFVLKASRRQGRSPGSIRLGFQREEFSWLAELFEPEAPEARQLTQQGEGKLVSR